MPDKAKSTLESNLFHDWNNTKAFLKWKSRFCIYYCFFNLVFCEIYLNSDQLMLIRYHFVNLSFFLFLFLFLFKGRLKWLWADEESACRSWDKGTPKRLHVLVYIMFIFIIWHSFYTGCPSSIDGLMVGCKHLYIKYLHMYMCIYNLMHAIKM